MFSFAEATVNINGFISRVAKRTEAPRALQEADAHPGPREGPGGDGRSWRV